MKQLQRLITTVGRHVRCTIRRIAKWWWGHQHRVVLEPGYAEMFADVLGAAVHLVIDNTGIRILVRALATVYTALVQVRPAHPSAT